MPDHDGRWQWTYHTAGNHESSGGDTTQGFETPDDAVTAACRVTGYTPPQLKTLHLEAAGDNSVEVVWAIPGRA
jgi:hypothetical protein